MMHIGSLIGLSTLGAVWIATAATSDTLMAVPDSIGVFELGKVVIKGRLLSTDKLTNQVDSKKMEEQGATNVAQALDLLPGVSVSMLGARYETGVNIRGFDLRQVPLYLDGVPQYVPYDGYVDIARFTTFDLSQIRVEKGYSSVLYGPNAMGGAINLVSRKPVHALEMDMVMGVKGYKKSASDTGWLPRISGNQLSLNIGSKINEKLYALAGVSGLYLDAYNLSKDFSGTKYQVPGRRNQSYHRDGKISAKIGFSPKEGYEYALSYMYQHGEKGGPLYAGPDAKVTPRYWRWPYWDKQSIYFTSRTKLGSSGYVKIPIYYDQFRNSLYSYDDLTYLTFKKPYAFKSWYDDYTVGTGLEAGTGVIHFNDLCVAAHYKRDFHSELNSNDTSKAPDRFLFVDETKRYYIDHTFDFGLEDGVKLVNDKLSINAGISSDHRASERADNYFKYHFANNPAIHSKIFIPDSISQFDKSIASSWNLQGRLGYDLSDRQNLNLSVSRKTRFPTIKDRYSYKLGTAYPNPDLKPEVATHLDLGYGAKIDNPLWALEAQCDLFYSHIDDAIQSVTVDAVKPDTGTKTQMQNVGEAEVCGAAGKIGKFALPGIELGIGYTALKNLFLANSLKLALSYSYAEKRNLTDPTIKFTDLPTQKYLMTILWSPVERSYLSSSFEWNSKRWVDSKGTRLLAGYRLLNLKACAGINKNISLEAGIKNVFDVNYCLQEGYPEEGRTYFANMRIGFWKN